MNLAEFKETRECQMCTFLRSASVELVDEILEHMASDDPPTAGLLSDYIEHKTGVSLDPERIRGHYHWKHGEQE